MDNLWPVVASSHENVNGTVSLSPYFAVYQWLSMVHYSIASFLDPKSLAGSLIVFQCFLCSLSSSSTRDQVFSLLHRTVHSALSLTIGNF